MKYVLSRFNHDISWVSNYTDDVVLYDRSEQPVEGSIVVANVGSDIYDKFTYIIDNYDNLPDVALYSKANLFKYISEQEFQRVKNRKSFTPLLTLHHNTYFPVCYYKEGLYYEINNYWYLGEHPARYANEIIKLFDMESREYNGFAPGSNYILPKENILQHPKELYQQLRSYLDWSVYPGDAQLIERNLYYLWH